jgi:hypothetical protein
MKLYSPALLYLKKKREKACSLVVTRAPVAPQVLSSTPRENEFSGFNGVCGFSGGRRSRRQRGVCGDFVDIEDLPAQSSKMFVGVGFTCVFIGMSVCALRVSPMYCAIRKKKMLKETM